MIKLKRVFTAGLMLLACACIYLCLPTFCVIKNVSESLPFSYFVGYTPNKLEVGMYATFEHPKSDILVAKRIAGLPGDKIKVENLKVYVNDLYCGEIKKVSPSGVTMSPISEGEIPVGQVFMLGLHPDSFDSRYQEFGLIAVSQVKERLWPLF